MASATPELRFAPSDIEMVSSDNAVKADADEKLDYKLPPLVKSVQQGWLGSCQASAVVAALFAAVEAQLIVLIKTPPDPKSSLRDAHPEIFHFLLLVSYSAFSFNCAATVTSLIISDQLGEMPFHSRELKTTGKSDSAHDLLITYQVGRRWKWLVAYWYLLLFCGGGCVFVQIAVYIWLHEGNAVSIVMTPVLALCAGSLVIPVLL